MRMRLRARGRLPPRGRRRPELQREPLLQLLRPRRRGMGGWVRMGNRPNEGYAEMTVCLYLPDGRVGFMFKRPHIDGHDAHDAGGLRFEVVAPYEEHHVTYDGKVCVLAQPARDGRSRSARSTNNPHEPCTDRPRASTAVVAAVGRRARVGRGRGAARPVDPRRASPAATPNSRWRSPGRSQVGRASASTSPTRFGLRDHSWGPRVWQSIWWYRWLTVSFGPTSASRCTVRGHQDDPDARNVSGFVYDVDRYGDDRVVTVRDMRAHLRLRRRVVRAPERRRRHHRRPRVRARTATCGRTSRCATAATAWSRASPRA